MHVGGISKPPSDIFEYKFVIQQCWELPRILPLEIIPTGIILMFSNVWVCFCTRVPPHTWPFYFFFYYFFGLFHYKTTGKGWGSFGIWKMAMGKRMPTNCILSSAHVQKTHFIVLYRKTSGKVNSILRCCCYRNRSSGVQIWNSITGKPWQTVFSLGGLHRGKNPIGKHPYCQLNVLRTALHLGSFPWQWFGIFG